MISRATIWRPNQLGYTHHISGIKSAYLFGQTFSSLNNYLAIITNIRNIVKTFFKFSLLFLQISYTHVISKRLSHQALTYYTTIDCLCQDFFYIFFIFLFFSKRPMFFWLYKNKITAESKISPIPKNSIGIILSLKIINPNIAENITDV